MASIAQRSLGALTAGAAWWLAVTTVPLVTVVQRDPVRSARAPRTADVSADGLFIAFESWARLVPADEDDRPDVYVLERATGQVTLESGEFDRETECSHARISADGRYVVFEVRDLVAERQPRVDIILRDRLKSITRSLTGNGATDPIYSWSRNPDISDDGQIVAFSSASTALTGGIDANGPLEDVYVVDVRSGAVKRVSVNTAGTQFSSGTSILPALSADGRWVAFASTAPLQSLEGGESPVRQVFLHDLAGGATTLASRTIGAARPNADSSLPTISGDGRYVAFTSIASNLSKDDRNRGSDVFLFDRDTGEVAHVSRGANGSGANGSSSNPSISADGRLVAFQSDAGNLVCAARCGPGQEDINLLWDIFVFNRVTRATVRISEDELGAWMELSMGPAIDGAGTVVAFSSRHPIDAGDRGEDLDLYVRQLPAATLTRRVP
jgi:Tol biopolymer transport system component